MNHYKRKNSENLEVVRILLEKSTGNRLVGPGFPANRQFSKQPLPFHIYWKYSKDCTETAKRLRNPLKYQNGWWILNSKEVH